MIALLRYRGTRFFKKEVSSCLALLLKLVWSQPRTIIISSSIPDHNRLSKKRGSFANNGSFGHTTNGDIAAFNLLGGNPTNCYSGNANPSGLTTSPAGLEQSQPTCNGAAAPALTNVPLIEEILCGNEGVLVGISAPCPGGKPYPRRTHVVMHPLPDPPTMPNPCRGVPPNPFCARPAVAPSTPPAVTG